jgi:hypothetical protein
MMTPIIARNREWIARLRHPASAESLFALSAGIVFKQL